MKPLMDRLMARVEKTDTCWLWTGAKASYGYGVLTRGRKGEGLVRAHRAMYEHVTGETIPRGMEVMHSCHVPACVNPAHLQLGTHAENMRMSWDIGRIKALRGEKAGNAKLTENQALRILSDPRPPAAIAREFGVRRQTVESIRAGRIWKHLPRSPD